MAGDASEQQVCWGIAGPGRIADSLAPDFAHVDGATLLAVGSRSMDRAAAFAARHDIERSYGSYRDLLDDPDIDVVYIATPHPQHHAIALAAVAAGKAVLVEKAFTATLAGAQEVVAGATGQRVFAMEAMWTRFQPAIVRMRQLLDDGAIGDVRSVQADLGVLRDTDPSDRLFAPELGGGALLDLGVYVVSFADMVLGAPDRVVVHGSIGPTGVEVDTALLLGYPDGAAASLVVSLHSPMPGQARIFGTAGWIDVLPRFHHPTQIVLHRPGAEPETITAPHLGGGYAHELIEVTGCLRAGLLQSATMPLSDTLAVQAVLDEAAAQLGVGRAEDAHPI